MEISLLRQNMGLYSVLTLLVTLTSLVITVRAPTPQLISQVTSIGSIATGLGNINPETWYSVRNAILIHTGCYRWCWLQTNKQSKEECYKTKENRCNDLKKFSYKGFIIYHLSKFGMGKVASAVLNAPAAILGTGIQTGTTAVTSVGNGVVAVGSEVGKGAAAVTTGLGNGGVAVAQGTGKVLAGGVQLASEVTQKSTGFIGDGVKSIGTSTMTAGKMGTDGLQKGVQTVTGSVTTLVPTNLFGWKTGN